MTKGSQAIGIDLGGTKIKAALVSTEGKLGEERHLASRAERGPKAIIDDIIGMVRELDPDGQLPIGIGVAGQVDRKTGAVLFGPNLKWWDVPLRAQMEQSLHQPVTVLNDVRAHTWGEWLYGAGVGCEDLVCLFIGTGVGGGVVSGGQIVYGATNTAGELGHMVIDPSGPVCGCGNKGCLEAWVSGINLEKQALELVRRYPSAGKVILQFAGNDPEKIDAKTVEKAYVAGDPLAQTLLESATQALILGAVNIVHAYNPKRLILGGGIIKGFPHLIARVREGVKQHALRAASAQLEVIEATLGNDAGIIGAAAVAGFPKGRDR